MLKTIISLAEIQCYDEPQRLGLVLCFMQNELK